MCSCTYQVNGIRIRFFYPYQKQVTLNVAFAATFKVSFEVVGFVLRVYAFISSLYERCYKSLHIVQIFFRTFFEALKVFLKLRGDFKSKHLYAIKQRVNTIKRSTLALLHFTNRIYRCAVQGLLNTYSLVFCSIATNETNEFLPSAGAFIYV